MSRAITNLIRLSMVAEVTAGTTPATPAMQVARATSENFEVLRNFVHSEEFNPVSQIVDQILINNRAQGGFNFEWAASEPALELCLTSALWGAWSSDILLAGITPAPLSIETKFEAGVTDEYKLFTGMHGNELLLNFNAGAKIDGTMAFIGMSSTFSATGTTGATYPAAGTYPVNTTGDMTLASAGLTVDAVTKMTLKASNNDRVHAVLGSYSPSAIARGTLDLSGDLEFYMNTGTVDWATNYLANTSFTLVATAGSTTLHKTVFTVPKAKFKTLKVMGAANNQDVMVVGTWEGFYDSATGSALKVQRNVA